MTMILLHEKDIHGFRMFLIKNLTKNRGNYKLVVNAFDRLITGKFYPDDPVRGPDSDKTLNHLTTNDNEPRADKSNDSNKAGFESAEKDRCDSCGHKCKTFFEKQTDWIPGIIAPTRLLWVCAWCKFPHST
jgi:hypothetical protein